MDDIVVVVSTGAVAGAMAAIVGVVLVPMLQSLVCAAVSTVCGRH